MLAATPAPDAVAIARLRQVRGLWRVDARFMAVRVDTRQARTATDAGRS
jgi:hypothetical protein